MSLVILTHITFSLFAIALICFQHLRPQCNVCTLNYHNCRGISLVTIALILPLLLLTTLGTLQLFLYFRAASAVEQAASEASRTLTAALPSASSTHELAQVTNKPIVNSQSGGDTLGNIHLSFANHGRLYIPPTTNVTNNIKAGKNKNTSFLPFPLTTSTGSTNINSKNDRDIVQYLPNITAWTCLKPHNESSHTFDACSSDANFLTYQLPSRMDFDGDKHEDLVFFYPNPNGNDWWVIPSSGGSLFRYNLQTDMTNTSAIDKNATNPLPCPADYDGDAKTDFCVLENNISTATLLIKFSSELYERLHSFTLNKPNTATFLPVSGTWEQASYDNFAVFLVNTTTQDLHLATFVWPKIQIMGNPNYRNINFMLSDNPTQYTSYKFKPASGQYWRPAFGDHDGNGLTDIGWLTWNGGYKTKLIATSPIESHKLDAQNTSVPEDLLITDNKFSPWKLYYPQSDKASGIYVVEYNSNRISLISNAHNHTLHQNKSYKIITGGVTSSNHTNQNKIDQNEIASPDPLGIQQQSNTNGGFSGDEGQASLAQINAPRDITGGIDMPLFIADYGNSCVRAILPGTDKIVNGSSDEIITSVVGGSIVSKTHSTQYACPLANGKNPTSPRPWNEYSKTAQESGIHPRCVSVQPLSIAVDQHTGTLLIGDVRGVVFAIYPGADGIVNSSLDETISILAGTFGKLAPNSSNAISKFASKLGYPISLKIVTSQELNNKDYKTIILIATSTDTSQTDSIPSGNIVAIEPQKGYLNFTNNKIVIKEDLHILAGLLDTPDRKSESNKTSLGIPGDATKEPAAWLRNPTDMVAFFSNDSTRGRPIPTLHIYLTNWWNDTVNSNFTNDILHIYPDLNNTKSSSLTSAKYYMRWISNPHLLSWGNKPPTLNAESFLPLAQSDTPLATIAAEPSGGITISPDHSTLYVSHTRLKQILSISLDTDSDEQYDYSTNDSTQDFDIDGDGIKNSDDPSPYFFQGSDNNISNSSKQLRPMDAFKDALMFAVSPVGTLAIPNSTVSRLEWWLDRFGKNTKLPYQPETPISPEESHPFLTLNANTIAIALPRGALHDSPVWPGGINLPTEWNPNTNKPLLAPVILTNNNPNPLELRQVSGYDHCTDWTTKENSQQNGIRPNGSPTTECGRSLTKPLYPDERTIGIRRTHLLHATNRLYPFTNNDNTINKLIFIDWDGDGIKDPVVFGNDSISNANSANITRPLVAHIGRLIEPFDNREQPSCPGTFAIPELASLRRVFDNKFSPPLSQSEQQYTCNTLIPFLGHTPLVSANVMVDTHAEWQTTNSISYVDLPLVHNKNGRLSDEKNNTGPVAETAYRVLEHMLKVKRRYIAKKPYDALVTITTENKGFNITGIITVKYVVPLNTFFAKIYGANHIIITRSVRRSLHQSEVGSP